MLVTKILTLDLLFKHLWVPQFNHLSYALETFLLQFNCDLFTSYETTCNYFITKYKVNTRKTRCPTVKIHLLSFSPFPSCLWNMGTFKIVKYWYSYRTRGYSVFPHNFIASEIDDFLYINILLFEFCCCKQTQFVTF